MTRGKICRSSREAGICVNRKVLRKKKNYFRSSEIQLSNICKFEKSMYVRLLFAYLTRFCTFGSHVQNAGRMACHWKVNRTGQITTSFVSKMLSY